jgi:hypothetical protein
MSDRSGDDYIELAPTPATRIPRSATPAAAVAAVSLNPRRRLVTAERFAIHGSYVLAFVMRELEPLVDR